MSNYTKEEGNQIANIMLQQLGGRVRSMIGVKSMGATENKDGNITLSVHFKAKGRNQGKACNTFKISLNTSDLYDIEIGYIRGGKYTARENIGGVYCDQLKSAVENSTGLYLSL